MTADSGAAASPSEGRERLVEELVAVRHHSAFGMHVDPLAERPVVGAESQSPTAGSDDTGE
jgi:hypothetical protein